MYGIANNAICTRGGALSRNTLPIQNQPCLCPDLPLYPSTLCTLFPFLVVVGPPLSKST